ncbi:hypothetical protein GV791_13720 [Nocardia cyriacigeorgica]|uniref:Tetracycline repressor TetR C-terminal domain-containing protein n=1 Tax=Nocardia cyriacigeorgica TaxID=135487 RepID=A0A6P1CU02_9NOCA|nr:hypothetical protein [Nocardia cyriacigeorgica]
MARPASITVMREASLSASSRYCVVSSTVVPSATSARTGSVESMEVVLTAIKPMGLSDVELISVIVMIDNFVVGAARTEVFQQEALRTTGMTDAEFWQAQLPMLERAMNSGRYPTMAGLEENAFDQDFDHFGFGLRRILDGLADLVEERARG